MKILLTWENAGGHLSPKFQSDIFNKDGVSPLVCLMMDDGGQTYLQTIPWQGEGVTKINLIKEGKIDSGDWRRDAWGTIDFEQSENLLSI
ncbi:MAG: hypothetical protein WA071_10170 [Undibacterium umbellatum]|uniref:hypothetical protein n=1 Tax=Undibacterium umbellatum TaxID=2762300 RepID=UPI003BB7210D